MINDNTVTTNSAVPDFSKNNKIAETMVMNGRLETRLCRVEGSYKR